MLQQSDLSKNISQLFKDGEYVIGDGIYPMKTWLVPVKRASRNRPLTGSDEKFNKVISSMRVRIENCFAMLKGRFRSLEELRLDTNNGNDMLLHSKWLRACCILHNFLLDHDLDQSLEYFIEHFYEDHQEVKKRVEEYQNFNFDSEDNIDDRSQYIHEDEEEDISDDNGKKKWAHLKQLILEDNLGKNIEELDRKHCERYQ
ncbi:hypothetical protein [Parasitella parasitica]|uniref:DDE Tnp4 domain-containing protein n=1 Tax=Parasitella parasitica TaxID=35722 RepID=A0A0B7MWC0_9FUNG|nr:hypothetical protein [Parasitella parasitica]